MASTASSSSLHIFLCCYWVFCALVLINCSAETDECVQHNGDGSCVDNDDHSPPFTAACPQIHAWLNQNGSIPGYHVLCITNMDELKTSMNMDANANHNNNNHHLLSDDVNFEFAYFREGILDTFGVSAIFIAAHIHALTHSSSEPFGTFRRELEDKLAIKRKDSIRSAFKNRLDRFNRWIFTDIKGTRLRSFLDLISAESNLVLIFESGLFAYPPIYLGYERQLIIKDFSLQSTRATTKKLAKQRRRTTADSDSEADAVDSDPTALFPNRASVRFPADADADADADVDADSVAEDAEPVRILTLTTLSTHPPIFSVSNLLSMDECDHIIALSEPFMEKSTVSHMHNTKGGAYQWRTSSTHFLQRQTPLTRVVAEHTAQLMHVPVENQESTQVLRYYAGEQYDSHWDYFDESLYKGTKMENSIRGGRNRFATVFWYMSDVSHGGWTYFPRAGNLRNPSSYKLKTISDCSDSPGLRVQPKKGSAVLFYSVKPDGHTDTLSLHGACPVGEGEIKWGANKWIWTKPWSQHYG